jgi:hypothetical protein
MDADDKASEAKRAADADSGLGATEPPIEQTGDTRPTHYSAKPAPDQALRRVEIPHQQHDGARYTRGTDTRPVEPDRTKPFDPYARQDAQADLRALKTLVASAVPITELIDAAKAGGTDLMLLSKVAALVRDRLDALVAECHRRAGVEGQGTLDLDRKANEQEPTVH